jgi:hypothetical protein
MAERALEHKRELGRSAFFEDPEDGAAVAPDEFAEMLAEQTLLHATSGETFLDPMGDAELDGYEGYFIETSGRMQFAFGDGGDDVEPAAFPTAVAGWPDEDES